MALAISSRCNLCAQTLQCQQARDQSPTHHKEVHSVSVPAWHQGVRPGSFLQEKSFLAGTALKHVRLAVASSPVNSNSGRGSLLQVRAQEAGTSTVVAQELDFVWKGSGTEVLLTGDFLNWDGRVPLARKGDGPFQVKQKVPPGRHTFKFIVDGVWQHSPDYPTVEDGAGGFNNLVEVTDAPAPPAPKEAPPPAAEKKPEPTAAGEPAGKKAVGKGKVAGKKAAAKPIGAAMEEDIIPLLKTALDKEAGLTGLTLTFEDNQLRGSFLKGGVPYAFWCYFPDGALEGARGFSLASHGGQPSTVEPFLIDERKVLPELLVFWVMKRLFAQKLLSLN